MDQVPRILGCLIPIAALKTNQPRRKPEKRGEMHIITSEGKIVEGQELTAGEAEILQELIASGINGNAPGTYIRESDVREIAKYLIENFRITRRSQPAEIAIEAIEREMPALAQPEAEAAPSTKESTTKCNTQENPSK